jgi:hypothetical protein
VGSVGTGERRWAGVAKWVEVRRVSMASRHARSSRGRAPASRQYRMHSPCTHSGRALAEIGWWARGGGL